MAGLAPDAAARSLFRFDPQRHRDVRLTDAAGPVPAWQANQVPIGLDEVPRAAGDYPLAFLKDAQTGRFTLVALLGLSPGRNLFLCRGAWRAVYLPLAMAASPLCLGGPERVLCLDEADPRVTTDRGEPLFDAAGSEAPALAERRGMLAQLDAGLDQAAALVAALVPLGLIAPVEIALQHADGSSGLIDGVYGINPAVLAALPAEELAALHGRGWLAAVFAIAQSAAQFSRLRQLHDLGGGPPIVTFEVITRTG